MVIIKNKLNLDLDSISLVSTVSKFIALYGCYKVVKWLYGYIRLSWHANKFPCEPCLPILGNLYEVTLALQPEYLNKYKELSARFSYSPIFLSWFATRPLLIFHKVEGLEAIYNTAHHIKKPIEYDLLKQWLGNGLIISDGNLWTYRRKLITPAFHFDILKSFVGGMNEKADILVEQLKNVCDDEIEILPYYKACALDLICELAMGKCVNAQTDKTSDYIKAVKKMSEITAIRIQTPWLYPNIMYKLSKYWREHKIALKTVRDFTRKIILERESEFTDNASVGEKTALLDTLLREKINHPEKITLDDIQEEVDTFMFAGHDTVSTAMTFITYIIGSYPEIQKKVQEEVDQVFGENNDNLTYDRTHELNYLECVIKETLRIFPPTPVIARLASEDFTIDGKKILKDTTLSIPIYNIHRDERYFPDPEIFKPERFLPENADKIHPYAFIPFSAGRRNCIGQKLAMLELKIMMAYILRNFNIESNQTVEELGIYMDILLKTKRHVLVKLQSRV